MESTHTTRVNNWSSFSQTTTATIVLVAILNLLYLLFERLSIRLDTFSLEPSRFEIFTASAATSSPQDISSLIQVVLFFGMFPAMLLIRHQIRHSQGIAVPTFGLFGKDVSPLSILLGSVAGVLIFLCVRFTIQSMLFV